MNTFLPRPFNSATSSELLQLNACLFRFSLYMDTTERLKRREWPASLFGARGMTKLYLVESKQVLHNCFLVWFASKKTKISVNLKT